jgi:hypothetical protein
MSEEEFDDARARYAAGERTLSEVESDAETQPEQEKAPTVLQEADQFHCVV